MLSAILAPGCGPAVRFIANTGDPSYGVTYYVGGAGPIGNVGSLDVPGGLKDAGYHGAVEAFTWQGLTHAGDQINLSRNRSKAVELSNKIREYRRAHPNKKINLIALSAGTGIAAFALEYLPEDVKVDNVVFLACSMSSHYDLTRALRRIRVKLYVVYSDTDPILRNVVWYTGTVDRASSKEGIAGLHGFRLPDELGPDTERQYAKVMNIPWRIDFSSAGYDGGHIDCTSREFIRRYVGPILVGNDESLVGREGRLADAPFTSRPERPPPRSKKERATAKKVEDAPPDESKVASEDNPTADEEAIPRKKRDVSTSRGKPPSDDPPARPVKRAKSKKVDPPPPESEDPTPEEESESEPE